MKTVKAIISLKESEYLEFFRSIDFTTLSEEFEIIQKKDGANLWSKLLPIIDKETKKELTSENEAEEDADLVNIPLLTAFVKIATLFLQKTKHRCTDYFQSIYSMHLLLGKIDQSIVETDNYKNMISLLCEQAYLAKEVHAEEFLPEVLTYLLVISLKYTPKVKENQSILKRLHHIRHGFLEMDIQDPANRTLQDLLIQCYTHPNYMKNGQSNSSTASGYDGINFLAFLLKSYEGCLVEPVSLLVKHQLIPHNVIQVKTISNEDEEEATEKSVSANVIKVMAIFYGQLFQRAWKEVVATPAAAIAAVGAGTNKLIINEAQQTIEFTVQHLLNEAVHARENRYFQALRSFMLAFHDLPHRSDLMEEMLVKVYEPIIWRSLKCANASVRTQAATLFFDVFPLQRTISSSNPNNAASSEEMEGILQRQFDALASLLQDVDHRVRLVAVSGVMQQVLLKYWEFLPTATIYTLLTYIAQFLVRDASSSSIRYQAMHGLKELLLHQHLAHDLLLQVCKPLVEKTLHDLDKKVRSVTVEILAIVKEDRSVHFYDWISVDMLLERMIMEETASHGEEEIAAEIARLLFNSYVPFTMKVTEGAGNEKKASFQFNQEHITRCFLMIESSPRAAEVFYGKIPRQMAELGCIGSLAKFLAMLMGTLQGLKLPTATASSSSGGGGGHAPVKRKRTGSTKAVEDDATGDGASNDLSNDTIIGRFLGLLRVITSILRSCGGKNLAIFQQEDPSLDLLFKYYSPAKIQIIVTQLLAIQSVEVIERSIMLGSLMEMLTMLVKLTTCYTASDGEEEDQSAGLIKLQEFTTTFHCPYLLDTLLLFSASTIATGGGGGSSKDMKWTMQKMLLYVFTTGQAAAAIGEITDRLLEAEQGKGNQHLLCLFLRELVYLMVQPQQAAIYLDEDVTAALSKLWSVAVANGNNKSSNKKQVQQALQLLNEEEDRLLLWHSEILFSFYQVNSQLLSFLSNQNNNNRGGKEKEMNMDMLTGLVEHWQADAPLLGGKAVVVTEKGRKHNQKKNVTAAVQEDDSKVCLWWKQTSLLILAFVDSLHFLSTPSSTSSTVTIPKQIESCLLVLMKLLTADEMLADIESNKHDVHLALQRLHSVVSVHSASPSMSTIHQQANALIEAWDAKLLQIEAREGKKNMTVRRDNNDLENFNVINSTVTV